MKTVKPLRLMALPRPYRWRNEIHLAVAVAALVEDKDGKHQLLPEHTLVHEVLPELDADEVLDFVMPKPNPEYLVSGQAYTHHQEEKTSCIVSVRVDDKRKDGLVLGDRYWIGNIASEPAPFDQMPLTWSNSFGGPDHPDNPLGTGLAEVEVEPGLRAIRLPNLEWPAERIRDRGQRVPPCNFGQVRIDWPSRMAKMGTCDQKWIETVGTGFFDDMQPSLFNAASPDQVWTDRDALRMDESFEIWNMHPELDCWSGVLPPLKARAFIERRGHKGELDEVAMRATTVWFLPHRRSYVLLFHGHIPIDEDDAYDVTALMVALERIDAPRDEAHYLHTFRARCDHEKAAFLALRDEDLMPADMLGPWFEKQPLDEHAMLSKLNRYMEGGPDAASGTFVGPVKPIYLADVSKLIERSDKELEELLAEHERERQNVLAGKPPAVADPGESEFERKLRRSIYERADISREVGRPHIPHSGPPDSMVKGLDMKAAETRRTMREVLEGSGGMGVPQSSTLGDAYGFVRRSLNKMYLYSVQFQDGVPRMDEHRAVALRRRILARYEKGRNLSGMNLTGADLSGMDLQGADFSESWLEGADLSGCNLAGAVFRETVLARADFRGACLDGARIQQANISEASFVDVSLAGTYIGEVIVRAPTAFRNCRFLDATLDDFDAEDMTFESCVLEGGAIRHVQLSRGILRGCRLNGCELEKMDIDSGLLEDVLLVDCMLTSCDFDETRLVRWEMQKCRATKLTLEEGMVLVQPVFSDCYFVQSLFREVRFEHANFIDTTLEQCDFSLANLEACRMERVQTPQSFFVRTNFDQANLSGSNLMSGNFQKARFIGTNLSSCNLFRADMSETLLDASTIVDRAYIQRTRTVPKRRNLPVAPDGDGNE
ncbi:DUF2169 domain-containing protein [Bordetella petrii]|uniref:DUF2169 family type VI secretion system accessory protein n=1 Tax=Bordetella petrii TaxID=94624 RepID=UPI00373249D4